MPPKMTKAARRTAAQSQKQKVRVPRQLRAGLDSQGQAWARLLNDPCGAPLAHPCYAGGDGGILMRFENAFDIGTGATDTAGVFVYTPGAIGVTGGNGTAIVTGVGASAAVNLTLAFPTAATQPGYTFLNTNASNVRAVSACIQITYLGAESARSGVVNFGCLNGGTFTTADTPNTGNASNVFEHFERTPLNTIEVKWRPTAFDQTFRDQSQGLTTAEISKCGAVGFSFSGLTAAAGLRIRMVCVYEYTPNGQVGIVNTSNSRSTSGNSMDNVLNYLDSTGNWMTRIGHSLGNLAMGAQKVSPYVRAAIYYAGTRTPGLLM